MIVSALSWKPLVRVKVSSPSDPTENRQSSLQLYSHFSSLFWSSTPSGWAPVSPTSLPIGNIGQQLPAHKLIVHYLLRAKWWRAEVNKCLCSDVNINNLRMAKFFLEELVLKDQQNIRLGISVIITFLSTPKVWHQLIFRTEGKNTDPKKYLTGARSWMSLPFSLLYLKQPCQQMPHVPVPRINNDAIWISY